MLEYKLKHFDDDYNILEIEFGKDVEYVKVKKFDFNDKNQIIDYYNKNNIVIDGIIIIYNVPTFVDMEPLIMPSKQSKCLSNLESLFDYYCRNKDKKNAERIYNIIYGKAYICNKVIKNELKSKQVFRVKEIMQINNEYKSVFSKLDNEIER